MALEVLSGEEEARLSFVGATRTLLQPAEGTIAVIDVGGGSSEIAVGEPDGRMAWSASFRIGSGFLADSYLRCDPPSVDELEKVRRHVAGTFEGLEPPPAREAVAVGGTATSLRRLLGAELSHETLERGIRVLCTTPIAEVAARFELDPERVRLLPAGILVLEAISDLLALPLRIARGGLREGVLLELVEGQAASLDDARFELAWAQQHHELAPVDPRQPALLHPHLRARERVDRGREVGVVADQQHVVAQPGRQRLGVEGPARELRLQLRLHAAELVARDARGVRRAHLGARQAGVELDADRLQGGARGARLLAPLVGEGTLRVGRPLGRIPVPQQPNHRDAPP